MRPAPACVPTRGQRMCAHAHHGAHMRTTGIATERWRQRLVPRRYLTIRCGSADGAPLLLARTNRARRTTHLQRFDETKSAIALRFAFPAYGNWIGKVMAVGRQWG